MKNSVDAGDYDVVESTDHDAKKCNLNDSELTTPTVSGSVSEDEGTGGWLGGIGADFRTLAVSLKETAEGVQLGGIGTDFRNLAGSLKETAGGVANFVQRSAMSVAAEIAQLERDRQLDGLDDAPPLHLPWELKRGNDSDVYAEDGALKAKILALSRKESTFSGPFSPKNSPASPQGKKSSSSSSGCFALDEPRINLIRRLLEIDAQLAATHARLSGRSDMRETVFWRNYFFHCSEIRERHFRERDNDDNDDKDDNNDDNDNNNKTPSRLSLGSLVPADSPSQDDSSFLIVNKSISSPPTSMNSYLSEEGIVLVGRSSAAAAAAAAAVNSPPKTILGPPEEESK